MRLRPESSLDDYKKNMEEKVIDTSRKLRVGIIGTGWIAGSHMNSYLNMPDVEVVAGADLVEGKAEAFFAKYISALMFCMKYVKQKLIKSTVIM